MPEALKQGKADITLVTGQSESGKSAFVKQQLAKNQRRALAWDVKGEYAAIPGWIGVHHAAELPQAMLGGHRRIAFVPRSMGQFDFWCRAAFAWGDCIVVADELADVTTPGKAPDGWGVIVRRGRARNLAVYGITQRPSESDKTILGNITRIRCCSMARFNDRAYMARELDVPVEVISSLSFDNLEFVERDMRTRKIVRGSLKTGRSTPLREGSGA